MRSPEVFLPVIFLALLCAGVAAAQSAEDLGARRLPTPGESEVLHSQPFKVDASQVPLRAPEGFRVNLFAEDLSMPREMALLPSGDVLVVESAAGRVRRLIDREGEQFPPSYRGALFVGFHGSWNREPLTGYEVVACASRTGSRPAAGLPHRVHQGRAARLRLRAPGGPLRRPRRIAAGQRRRRRSHPAGRLRKEDIFRCAWLRGKITTASLIVRPHRR